MDYDLSEEQKILRTAARDFLRRECPASLVREMEEDKRGYPPELWTKMAELGWMQLVFPEQYGGSGSNFLDLIVLVEEMGYRCLPSPYFSTIVLGGLLILDMGSEQQKQEILPKIASGEVILTLGWIEPGGGYSPEGITVTASNEGGGYVISGTKIFVPNAHVADYMICVARSGQRLTLFLVDNKTPGISQTLLKTTARDKQYEVVFNKVRVSRKDVLGMPDQGWNQLVRGLRKAAVAKCAEMVGGAQRVLDMTVDYVKQRAQFGHPVGSYQAIQHHCANMTTDLDTSRLVTYEAAWKISEGLPYAQEAAIAIAWVSEAYKRIVKLGHQSIGGVSLIEDHDMPLYSRRSNAVGLTFGDADFHREVLAREMAL